MRSLFLIIFALSAILPVTASAGKNDSPQALNQALGMKLWNDRDLWDDPPEKIAERLKLPLLFKSDKSGRYAYGSSKDKPKSSLGVKPDDVVLDFSVDKDGKTKTEAVTIMFANKNTMIPQKVFSGKAAAVNRNRSYRRKAIFNAESEIKTSEDIIYKKLKELLGYPRNFSYGKNKTKEKCKAWVWNKNQYILLSSPNNEYVRLRVVPLEIMKRRGKPDRIRSRDLAQILLENVEKLKNGDTLINNVPFYPAKNKKNLVPATWVCYLLYFGIPVDVWQLDLAANMNSIIKGSNNDPYLGEETYPDSRLQEYISLADAANDIARTAGLSIARIMTTIKSRNIERYIKKGVPLMWMAAPPQDFINKLITRNQERPKESGAISNWNKSLAGIRKKARRIKCDKDNIRIFMIIGFNKTTEEMAVSDSAHPQNPIIWMTFDEAREISKNRIWLIK